MIQEVALRILKATFFSEFFFVYFFIKINLPKKIIMNKIIGIIIFLVGGSLWYLVHNVWEMTNISWIVAIIVIFLTGKFMTKDD